LTREEMAAQERVRFDQMDANGDGQLSADELGKMGKKRAEKRAAKMMKRVDANDDGMISFEEMSSGKMGKRQTKMFDRIDADGNGSLSEEEFAKLGEHRGGKHKRQKSGE
jgi:Ca2+-binding EF-hand superfamily protein